ncbi:hypothetical protein BDW62DRAFT_193629 [Aspergillus aurantiobrunneus]
MKTCSRKRIRLSIPRPCESMVILPNCPFPAGSQCVSQWKHTYNLHLDAVIRNESMRQRAYRKASGRRKTLSPECVYTPCKTLVRAFRDHAGNESSMVFLNEPGCALPPLANLSI